MKDLISEAISKKLTESMAALGGAKALYGDPITFNGEQIIPVARVTVLLAATAEGSGGGNAGLAGSLGSLARGNGGGNANAGVTVRIEPVGFLRATPQGPVYCPLSPD